MWRSSFKFLILILIGVCVIALPHYAGAHTFSTNYGHDVNGETKIIWTSNRNNAHFDIWIMNEDGTGATVFQNTNYQDIDEHPIWKPDGSQIVFISNNKIYLLTDPLNPGTSPKVPCLTDASVYGHATYNPDGTKIIYTKLVVGKHEIWILDISGITCSNPTSFHADGNDNIHPHFSPDGTKIVFAKDLNNDGSFGIYTVDYPSGGNLTPIYADGGVPASAPTWSPDGAKIVHSRDSDFDGRYEIWVMDAGGTNPVKLTDPPLETPESFNDITTYFRHSDLGILRRIDYVRDIGNTEIYRIDYQNGWTHTETHPTEINLTNHPNEDRKVVESTCGCNPNGVQFDFGDAPDPTYPSLLQNNGARHLDITKEWLGPLVDRENNARIIDLDFFDDGVILPQFFVPSVPSVITINVSSSGIPGRYNIADPAKRIYINGWADWNGDGDWQDAGEKIVGTGSGNLTCNDPVPGDTVALAGAGSITCTVTPTQVPSTLWLRFRLDYGEDVGNVQNLSGTLNEEVGEAKWGEVEDYQSLLPDFGDAYDQICGGPMGRTYPSCRLGPHAKHLEYREASLGPGRTVEPDSKQPDADEDDGVVLAAVYTPGAAGTATFNVTVTPAYVWVPGNTVFVKAWFDWNHNDWWEDPGELMFIWSGKPGTGAGAWSGVGNPVIGLGPCAGGAWSAGVLSCDFRVDFIVPAATPSDPDNFYFARFRLKHGFDSTMGPTGDQQYGEVEDWKFKQVKPTLIRLSSFNVIQRDGMNYIFWTTGAEIDTEGFHILRSASPGGLYSRITPSLIESTGGAFSGGRYSFVDTADEDGKIYYYKIEEVDSRGIPTQYGPVAAVAMQPGDVVAQSTGPSTVEMSDSRKDRPSDLSSEQVAGFTPTTTREPHFHQREGSIYTIVAYADGPARFLSGEAVDAKVLETIIDTEQSEVRFQGPQSKEDVKVYFSPDPRLQDPTAPVAEHPSRPDTGGASSPTSIRFKIIDMEGNEIVLASIDVKDEIFSLRSMQALPSGILSPRNNRQSGDFTLKIEHKTDRAILTWYATEPVKGFHIIRSTKKEGPYYKITKNPIPYIGTGIEGIVFHYTYTDIQTQKGKNYYYKLESINNERGETALR